MARRLHFSSKLAPSSCGGLVQAFCHGQMTGSGVKRLAQLHEVRVWVIYLWAFTRI